MDTDLITLVLQTFALVFAAVFPVLNPFGSAVVILPLTQGIDQQTRHTIAKKVGANCFFLLTVVLLVGSYVLAFFGISVPVVQTAGGLVLASMGWKSLSADDPIDHEQPDKGPRKAPLGQTFYPFTFPLTVGPGSVAVTLTLSAHTTHTSLLNTAVSQGSAVAAFLLLGVIVYLCMAYTSLLLQRLGPSGTKAVMRLMSFVILCIGAQICWTGLATLILSVQHH